jgi:hypothetical protein
VTVRVDDARAEHRAEHRRDEQPCEAVGIGRPGSLRRERVVQCGTRQVRGDQHPLGGGDGDRDAQVWPRRHRVGDLLGALRLDAEVELGQQVRPEAGEGSGRAPEQARWRGDPGQVVEVGGERAGDVWVEHLDDDLDAVEATAVHLPHGRGRERLRVDRERGA